MRYTLAFFITFAAFQWSVAQKLTHKLGEVLVEVRSDEDAAAILKDLRGSATFRNAASATQVIAEPMNVWLFKVNPNQVNEIKFHNKLVGDKRVLVGQKNHIFSYRAIPNDTLFTSQWQYINDGRDGGSVGADMDMDLAWDIATGGVTAQGDTIVACVIDDGLSINHPDYQNNIWVNRAEIPDNGIDDDNNGYVDDVYGINTYNNSSNVLTGGGHGMPVSGIIGVDGNNGIGVSGINWDVKVMHVIGGGNEANALASYAYPYVMRKKYNETNGAEGAFVVTTNASWGTDNGLPEDAPIWCEFYDILGEEGILNCGATANANTNVDTDGDLPTACQSDYLVSVTNLNRTDEKETFAGFGLRTIDLGAYGEDTYTITRNGYGGFGGTSGATPHVAGVVALIYSIDCPDLITLAKANPAGAALAVKDYILKGVVANSSLSGITVTGGKLNAFNALSNAIASCEVDCIDVFGTAVSSVDFDTQAFSWPNAAITGPVNLRYRLIGSADWETIENFASGQQLSNLLPCQEYEFQTATICNGQSSGFSYPQTFKTMGCCEIPRGITVELGSGEATVKWSEVDAASSFLLQYREVDSADWIEEVVNAQDREFTIENVFNCTPYEYRLQSVCTAVNTTSDISDTRTFSGECGNCTNEEYCEFGVLNTSDEWIEYVEIEDVFFNETVAGQDGYSSFIGRFNITLTSDSTYTLRLRPGYSGTQFNEGFSAFIDYNHDGNFTSNEEILASTLTSEEVSGEFTVPSNAVLGITRLRVVMRFNGTNGPCQEGGFEFGEVEDYCVEIRGPIICPQGVNYSVDSLDKSFAFEFVENDVEEYFVALKEVGGTDDLSYYYSNSPGFLVEDLSFCTEYEIVSGWICLGDTFQNDFTQLFTTSCVSNTSEPTISNIVLSPNPTTQFINVAEFPAMDQTSFIVYNVLGKQFLTGDSVPSQLDVSQFAKGVYYIVFTRESQRQTATFIKL